MLTIFGDSDTVISASEFRSILDTLEQHRYSEIVSLKEGSHQVMQEKPEQVNAAILSFLQYAV